MADRLTATAPNSVIPGLDPGIHVAPAVPAAPWMPGSSPGMTVLGGGKPMLARMRAPGG